MSNKRHFWIIVIVALIIALYVTYNRFKLSNNLSAKEFNNIIVAHRAYSLGHPENSISSLKQAIKDSVQAVEVDVRLTKDHELIVLHDKAAARMAGKDRDIVDLTLADIKKLKLSSKNIKEEEIPTLDEVLKVINKSAIKVILDIKIDDNTKEMVSKISEVLNKYKMNNRVLVSSFYPYFIYEIKSKRPDLVTSLIFEKERWGAIIDPLYVFAVEKFLPNFLGVSMLEPDEELFSLDLYKYWKNRNIDMAVWVVNKIQQKDIMAKNGITYISDYHIYGKEYASLEKGSDH